MNLSLEGDVQETKFSKGSLIFKQGDPVEYLYLVKDGEVTTFSAEKGQIVPLYTVIAQEMLADESVIHKNEYNYNAVATEDTTLIQISASDVKAFLDSTPKWISNLMNLLSEKIIETEHIITEHKIRDELLTNGQELSPEKLALLTKSLKV